MAIQMAKAARPAPPRLVRRPAKAAEAAREALAGEPVIGQGLLNRQGWRRDIPRQQEYGAGTQQTKNQDNREQA
jgi:hypothetical protein